MSVIVVAGAGVGVEIGVIAVPVAALSTSEEEAWLLITSTREINVSPNLSRGSTCQLPYPRSSETFGFRFK